MYFTANQKEKVKERNVAMAKKTLREYMKEKSFITCRKFLTVFPHGQQK